MAYVQIQYYQGTKCQTKWNQNGGGKLLLWPGQVESGNGEEIDSKSQRSKQQILPGTVIQKSKDQMARSGQAPGNRTEQVRCKYSQETS